VLVSRSPAAGRLNDQEVGRLKTLLTSKQFRQEVAREAERKARAPAPVCTDQITTEVTMGSLSMSRTGPCGSESESTPVFDEIVSIVAPAMHGSFDRSVDTVDPRLLPMRLERFQLEDQPGYTIKVDAAGRAKIAVGTRQSELHALSVRERDTLRLLQARLIETPAAPCTFKAPHYQLQVDTDPPLAGPDCAFPERQPEFYALAALLENDFGV
jgi:hypothetical protein